MGSYTLSTPTGNQVTVQADSDEEAIEKARSAEQASAPQSPAGPSTKLVPLRDQDGNNVRIFLSPTVAAEDAGWLTDIDIPPDAAKRNLLSMPGDNLKGGYLATAPTAADQEEGGGDGGGEGAAGYWEKTARNAPGSLLGAAQSVATMANPMADASSNLQMGYRMATDPKFRSEVVKHYKNYLSLSGWAENFQEDPFGVALDVGGLATPGPKRAPLPKSARVAIPSTAELKSVAGGLINTAKKSGVYFTDDFVGNLRQTIKSIVDEDFFTGDRRGDEGLLETLEKDIGVEAPWDFRHIQRVKKSLNNNFSEATKQGYKETARTIARIRAAVDKFVEGTMEAKGEGLYRTDDITPERAAEMFIEGNKAYRQAKVAEMLEGFDEMADIDAKQFTQSGKANTLRKYVRQILRQDVKAKRGKAEPTGLKPEEIKVLKQFNKGQLSDWILQKAARHASATVGAVVGSTVGGPLATTIGSIAGAAVGETAKSLGSKLAERRFYRFIEAVRADGGNRLRGVLGEGLYQDMVGTKAGRDAISTWQDSIGTTGYTAATKALAMAGVSITRDKAAAERIYTSLHDLEEEMANQEYDVPDEPSDDEEEDKG